MKSGLMLGDAVTAEVLRNRGMSESLRLSGYVIAECFGPDGKLKWRDEGENLIVDEGINHILDTAMSGDTQDTTYFVGLKDTGTPAGTWTLATGLTEINPYAGNRIAWTEDNTAADESVSNAASPASFSINATDTVFGAFLATVDTGTAGVLIGAKDFAASQAVTSGDTLNVTYTINGSSS